MTEHFDITAKVGPLHTLPLNGVEPEIPMYSYERPAYMLWNAIGKALHEKGWSDVEITEWLRSKSPRYCLDDDLGDAITELCRAYADKITKL